MVGDVARIVEQLVKAQAVAVEELLAAGDRTQRELQILDPGSLELLAAGDDLVAGGLHDLVEAPHHDERQDDLAVVGLLVVAAQQLSDAPDEVCVIADLAQAVRRHGGHGGLAPLGVLRSVARAGSR